MKDWAKRGRKRLITLVGVKRSGWSLRRRDGRARPWGRVGWNEPLGGQLQRAADAMKVADGAGHGALPTV